MATRTSVPLEPETGIELCRVKLEGGSLGGYRSDILTENLSEREGAIYKCSKCSGIMKDASIGKAGEQLCSCCITEKEQSLPSANVRNTILSLKCACPLFKRDCEWLGRLEIVENHLTTCGHVYESCQLLCGVVTTRDEMGRHVREECSQREEACLHCSGVHKVCEMVEHVKVCGKVFVLCELGCGTRVRRESILFHRGNECSEESVVCPYEKCRCEVVGLKRRELKQHLEENSSLHTELKLTALEERFEESQLSFGMIVKKNELLEKKVESLENELKMKVKEIEILTDVQARHVCQVKWAINEFVKKFQPNISCSYSGFSVVPGYRFRLAHSSDAHNFIIDFVPRNGDNYDSLEWPFKAIFITRVVCHRNTNNSLIFKSPLIFLSKQQYTWSFNLIASIPLSTDLKEFIKSEFGIGDYSSNSHKYLILVTYIIFFLNASCLLLRVYTIPNCIYQGRI